MVFQNFKEFKYVATKPIISCYYYRDVFKHTSLISSSPDYNFLSGWITFYSFYSLLNRVPVFNFYKRFSKQFLPGLS